MNQMLHLGSKDKAMRWIIIFVLAMFAQPTIADEVVAKKAGVKVLDRAAKTAGTLKTLKKGEEVSAVERQGLYWVVKLPDGKTGYVSVLQVSRKSSEKSKISNAIRRAVREERDTSGTSTARARSSVMGVRGLSSSDNTEFAGNARPDMEAVYAMEDRSYSEADYEKIGEAVFREIAVKSQNAGPAAGKVEEEADEQHADDQQAQDEGPEPAPTTEEQKD
jgi:hypothetical protein